MIEEPEPNGEPQDYGDLLIQLRVCSCCKDPVPRYFVWNADGKMIRMAWSFRGALGLVISRYE